MFPSKIGRAVAVGCVFFLSSHAGAWDNQVTGTVLGFDVSDGQNLGFRVYLSGVTSYCNATSYDVAYINEADSNYKTYVAAIISAKAAGDPVTLYLTRFNGACKIGYLSVR